MANARIRCVDWSAGSGAEKPDWVDLAGSATRELLPAETVALRDLLVAKINAALWVAVGAVIMGALGAFGIARHWGDSSYACLGLSPLIAFGAWTYARQARGLKRDAGAAQVSVRSAPMPRRADGKPAERVEVESGGQRVSLEVRDPEERIEVEILPHSGRVWRIGGRPLP